MPDHEKLIGAIAKVWDRGTVGSDVHILPAELAAFTQQRMEMLFSDECELTVTKDANGMTVVSRREHGPEAVSRTILAAQLQPEKTLTIELHNRQTRHHFAGTFVGPEQSCQALELDLASNAFRLFLPAVVGVIPKNVVEERPVAERSRLCRVLVAGALLQLTEAVSAEDVLSSPYARRNVMETHCADDRAARHPADTFFMPTVQETVRAHLNAMDARAGRAVAHLPK